MTTEHADKFRRLACCHFYPGSWDKRFVRSLTGGIDGFPGWEDRELSEKQIESLERLWHKYRRQLGTEKKARRR